MSLHYWFALSAVMLALGIFGFLSRRNVLSMIMSAELIFNAGAINFVAFNRLLYPEHVWGQAFVVFILALAAAEAVLGFALVLAWRRTGVAWEQ